MPARAFIPLLVVLLTALGLWLAASRDDPVAARSVSARADGVAPSTRTSNTEVLELIESGRPGGSGHGAAVDPASDSSRVAPSTRGPSDGTAAAASDVASVEGRTTGVTVVLRVRGSVRTLAPPQRGSMELVTVLVRLEDGSAATTRAGLGGMFEVEFTRPLDPEAPASSAVGRVALVASHPGLAPFHEVVDRDSRWGSRGLDARGRIVLSTRVDVRLAPYAALLRGHAEDAREVVLIEYGADADRFPLRVVDRTSEAAEYELRVPRPGRWLVVALASDRHPCHALVEVPPPTSSEPALVDVLEVLRPSPTRLVVESSHPEGWDPAGTGVLVAAMDLSDGGRGPGDPPGGWALGEPLLGWQRDVAPPPGLEPWGWDLTGASPEPEAGRAVVPLVRRATLDAAGHAELRGGPSGLVQLRVQSPFDERLWVPTFDARVRADDRAVVVPPVARLDLTVVALGLEERPVAGGRVVARAGRDHGGRRSMRATGAEDSPPLDASALDQRGRATLYVPSDARVVVEATDETGALGGSEGVDTGPARGRRGARVQVHEAGGASPAPGGR